MTTYVSGAADTGSPVQMAAGEAGEAIAAPQESRYPELVAGLIEEFLDAP